MKLNRKNKLLTGGFVCMLYICYKFAFSNTIAYYTQYNLNKEQFKKGAANQNLLSTLEQKNKQLDQELKKYAVISGTSFQSELLNRLARLSNTYSLKIISFDEPHVFNIDNVTTSSYGFSLEGSFNGIILLLNAIENDGTLGYVKHISFNKKTNYKENTDYLVADIVLQKTEPSANGQTKTPD